MSRYIPRAKVAPELRRAHTEHYMYENGAFQDFMVRDWDRADLGWLGGILDGEGSFTIIRRRPGKKNGGGRIQLGEHYTVQIVVGSIDREIPEKCAEITGVGRLTYRVMKHRVRALHTWAASGWEARAVALMAHPYLVAKQPQADLVLGPLNEETWNALRVIHGRGEGGDAA